MTTYTNRLNALSKEKTYVLTDTGIGDGIVEWPYEELKEIHLKFAPTRHYGGIYQCRISSAKGAVVLSNRQYKGLADFEYDNEGFAAFVRELHRRVEHLPHVNLRSGKPKAKFIFEIAALAIFFPLILWVLFAIGQALVAGIILLILLIRLIPYYGKNRPRVYTGSDIPEGLLP